jgi:hypothetical protein
MTGYGKSAFVKGIEIYSTDGKPVDLKAVCTGSLTVEEVVMLHQRQPEIVRENRLAVLLWFVGIPVIAIVLCRLLLAVMMRGPAGTVLIYLAVYVVGGVCVAVIVVSVWKIIELLIKIIAL